MRNDGDIVNAVMNSFIDFDAGNQTPPTREDYLQ